MSYSAIRIFYYYIFSLLISISISGAVTAKQTLELLTLQIEPYGYIANDSSRTGLIYEIMETIKQASQIDAIHRLVPPKRIIARLSSNVPACSLIVYTYNYSDNFIRIESADITIDTGIIAKSAIQLNRYQDLSDLTIAVPLGMKINEKFDNDQTLKKVFPPRYENAIEMLKHGTIDAIAGAIPTLIYLAKQHELPLNSLSAPLILNQGTLNLVCNKAVLPEAANILKESLNKLKENGKLLKIKNSYF